MGEWTFYDNVPLTSHTDSADVTLQQSICLHPLNSKRDNGGHTNERNERERCFREKESD